MTAKFSPQRVTRLHDIMNRHVEGGKLPGIVTLIARGDEVHVDAIGAMAFDGQAMQRDSIFRIASISKPITAVAALILIEEGILRLDDPIDSLIPELANRQVLTSIDAEIDNTVPAYRPTTMRDLMTFTSGHGIIMAMPDSLPIQRAMTAIGFLDGPPSPGESPAPDEWIRQLGSLPLLSQPGERWHYNTGSNILGVLIARATGQSFSSFLEERIFAPLGMKDTGFSVAPDKINRLVTAYETSWGTGEVTLSDDATDSAWSTPPRFEAGAAGLVSTADDLLAFGRMLRENGKSSDGERIISRAAIATMTTDHLTPAQKTATGMTMSMLGIEGWGFGVSVTNTRTDLFTSPGRYGWDGGFGTSWANDPAEDLTGILLTQVSWASPTPPAILSDFWNATYTAIED